MRLRPRRLVAVLVVFFIAAINCYVFTPRGIAPAPFNFHAQRAAHQTTLQRPPPDLTLSPTLPTPHTATYPAPVGDLKVWVQRPDAPRPHPTILYFHDGVALEAEELARVSPFVAAGYAVVIPTWRGEHGNPGQHEFVYGELEDAQAAVRWTAEHPDFDEQLLFTFGVETGGILSAMLSLQNDLPITATASVSAMVQPRHLDPLTEALPFEEAPLERQLRSFTPYFSQVYQPHIAYVGEADPLIAPYEDVLQTAIERDGTRVNLLWTPGDARAVVPEAITAFIQQIGP